MSPRPIVCTQENCSAALTSNSQTPFLNELSFCLKHHSLVLNQCHKMSLEIADWNLYPYAIDRHFDWQAAFYSQACSDRVLWFWFAEIWVDFICHWFRFLFWVLWTFKCLETFVHLLFPFCLVQKLVVLFHNLFIKPNFIIFGNVGQELSGTGEFKAVDGILKTDVFFSKVIIEQVLLLEGAILSLIKP